MSLISKGVAIVTGAGQGIGRSIALRLARDGYCVAVNDISSNADAANRVVDEISSAGQRVILALGDVSKETDVKSIIAKTITELGQLNVMVANAGIAPMGSLLTTDAETFDRTMSVNARGTFLCYKHAAEQMIKQGNGGRIVGACSILGKRGSPDIVAYSASKFAIRSLTQSAAQELGKYGITVNSYAPGCTITTMMEAFDEAVGKITGTPQGALIEQFKNMSALKKTGTPDDISAFVSYIVSDEAQFVTGQNINVDGGIIFD